MVGGADHRDRAEAPGLDQLARRRLPRAADALAADLEDPLVPIDRGDDVEALVDRVGHRLLDVDVLAGRHRVDRHPAVPVIRRGDEDGVDGPVVEQPPVVVDDGGLAAGPGPAPFGPAAVGVAQRDDLGVGAARGNRVDQLLGPGAHAGEADSHAIAGRRGRARAL